MKATSDMDSVRNDVVAAAAQAELSSKDGKKIVVQTVCASLACALATFIPGALLHNPILFWGGLGLLIATAFIKPIFKLWLRLHYKNIDPINFETDDFIYINDQTGIGVPNSAKIDWTAWSEFKGCAQKGGQVCLICRSGKVLYFNLSSMRDETRTCLEKHLPEIMASNI